MIYYNLSILKRERDEKLKLMTVAFGKGRKIQGYHQHHRNRACFKEKEDNLYKITWGSIFI